MQLEPKSTLEKFMLGNVLQCPSNQQEGVMSVWSDWWEKWAGVGLGAGIIIIGIIGLLWCPDPLGIRLSEAIFIAGIVTVAVDPFLKRRLVKEASKDIFHHLLGFDFPEQIRETLKLFLTKNRFYHRNTDIEAIVKTISADAVQVTLSVRSEIVAIANTSYHQHFACEESEHGNILQASITSTLHPEMDDCHFNPALTSVKEEPSVFEWDGKEVTLKSGEKLNYFLRYTVERPKNDFFTHNFGSPTIYPILRVSGSEDLNVTASASEQRNGNQYIYMKVFLVGDHIQVRWRSKTGDK